MVERMETLKKDLIRRSSLYLCRCFIHRPEREGDVLKRKSMIGSSSDLLLFASQHFCHIISIKNHKNQKLLWVSSKIKMVDIKNDAEFSSSFFGRPCTYAASTYVRTYIGRFDLVVLFCWPSLYISAQWDVAKHGIIDWQLLIY
jgi:hypothetical protein